MKKAQASLFIALGLLILIAFGSIIFFKQGAPEEKKHTVIPIDKFVEQCLNTVTDDAINIAASKGGRLSPNNTISYGGKQISVLAYYDNGIHNVVPRIRSLEEGMARYVEENLDTCLNLRDFERQGFEISKGTPKANITIAQEKVYAKLNLELTLTRGKETQDFELFSTEVDKPLGMLILSQVDILNSETHGYFDKERYMLAHDISIQKHKPYPDTIYVLSDIKSGLTYYFAIRGKDTVGKEPLTYMQEGCCQSDDVCVLNPISCPFEYDKTCDCKEIQTIDNSHGKDCMTTYNYIKEDYSGPGRKHGTSWCSYESVAGKGLDYVGTRHYLHSCIDGVEYIEECRDYREEICVESVENKKGLCRTNRWEDCYMQDNKNDCEDKEKRDCVWAGYLWTDKKCHPEVPPGLKFWERESKEICNIASMNKDQYGEKYPKSWGHSSLLYCQRTGDCGNYRNYADVLTELGYFNRDGEPEPWVYWEDGLTSKGDRFVVKSQMYVTPEKTKIPKGKSGGDAVCDAWQAPNNGECSACKNKLHPCTEYRCRSLGKNCVFDKGVCRNNVRTDKNSPKTTLKDIQPGFSFTEQKSTYYDLTQFGITPAVMTHTPFLIAFETSKPTRCSLGLRPPMIAMGTVDLPEIQLNDYRYKTKYQINISFPASNLTRLHEYLLFIRCNDMAGNKAEDIILKVNTADLKTDTKKPIVLRDDRSKDGTIFLNEPATCRTSEEDKPYEDMEQICEKKERDILYDVKYPIGSFACKDAKKFVECRDDANNSLRITD